MPSVQDFLCEVCKISLYLRLLSQVVACTGTTTTTKLSINLPHLDIACTIKVLLFKMTMCFFASLLICLQSSPARWRQLKHMVTTQKWNPLGGEAAIWHRPASRPQWPAAYGAVDSSSWEALSEKIVRYLAATSQSCQAGFLPYFFRCATRERSMIGRTAQWQSQYCNVWGH